MPGDIRTPAGGWLALRTFEARDFTDASPLFSEYSGSNAGKCGDRANGGWPRFLNLAGITNTVGAPFFAFFAKGGSRECRRQVVCDHVYATKSNSTRSIAAHPCQKNARMGHPHWEWCTQRSLQVGHPSEDFSLQNALRSFNPKWGDSWFASTFLGNGYSDYIGYGQHLFSKNRKGLWNDFVQYVEDKDVEALERESVKKIVETANIYNLGAVVVSAGVLCPVTYEESRCATQEKYWEH